ncbi:MAG: TonB-dependent receptor [Candidatus Aminicenantes bacterium]|nr:TonB-dependent receptor [Candidatus Aminicenantes bacterium]
MSRRTILLISLVLFAAAAVLPAAGSETGEVQGRVLDDEGTGLPGVTITARSPRLQGSRETVSGPSGAFRFPLLPVGVYTLTYALDGFASVVQENVAVRLGLVTRLTAALKPAEIQREITVVAPAPLIDTTSTDTSFNLSAEHLAQVPVLNRTVVDAVKFTPGASGVRVSTRYGNAQDEGQPSFRGEGEEGNNWVVDGLTISGVRLKNAGMKLNYDAIEEVQVISDPFSPEYGSAYGGIINMVTKSGGNDFSGEAAFLFQDKALQSARRAQLSVGSEPDYFSQANGYLNLGGPLIRDKLWFFVSDNVYSDREETSDAVLDYLSIPRGEKVYRRNSLFAKLTYSLSADHNLSLTGAWNQSFEPRGGTGIPELYEDETYTDSFLRLNYKGILSPTSFIEAGLGTVVRDNLKRPKDGDLGPAQHYVEDLAQNLNNSYGTVTDQSNRLDFGFKYTKHLDIPKLGRHEIKLGLEYYSQASVFDVDFTGQDEDIFPGNGYDAGTKYHFNTWRDGMGTPTAFFEYNAFNFTNSSYGLGVFIRDKVTWGPVTFMAGLRSQTQICLDQNKDKLWSWGLGDFLSPRVSLTVDLTGDGVNVVKLGWGRFSDLITTMALGFFNPGQGLSFRTYRWQGPENPTQAEVYDPAHWIFQAEQSTQNFDVAEGIKPNFLSRFLLEFDRRLGRDWAVKARYVQTSAKELLEVLLVFDPQTNYKFLFDNFEHKRRDYRGLELELNGRLGPAVFFNASYAYGLARGTNPGQTEPGAWSQEEGGTNYVAFFGKHIYIPPLPELAEIKAYYDWALGGLGGRGIGDEGWYGKLPYSVDHTVKVNTVLAVPWGMFLSVAFEWLSGYPWEKKGYVPYFGGYYSYPEGRGVRRTPAHAYLDLGLEKSFKLGARRALSFRLDVLNLFNSQQPVAFVKEDIPIFGQVWGRQNPRQARLMARFKW